MFRYLHGNHFKLLPIRHEVLLSLRLTPNESQSSLFLLRLAGKFKLVFMVKDSLRSTYVNSPKLLLGHFDSFGLNLLHS